MMLFSQIIADFYSSQFFCSKDIKMLHKFSLILLLTVVFSVIIYNHASNEGREKNDAFTLLVTLPTLIY